MRPALGPALVALLAAAAAAAAHSLPGSSADHTQRDRRVIRSIVVPIDSVSPAGGAGGASGAGGDAASEPSEAVLAELAEVPAEWQSLWRGALAARSREPSFSSRGDSVLVQRGEAAFLHCPVRDLGERGVSWVRRRDWHIISSGLFMYTNDERFQVLHNEGSDDWILQIKYVQKRDNGTYECQVSTSSGTVSRQSELVVAAPEALILGADEYHVDAGSTINLVCIIENSPIPPQYVFWYHNERMINYDSSGGVRVVTQATPGARTQSALAVRGAAPTHSGNYSCRAPNTDPAHIYVYVSEGSDKMAATLSRNSSPFVRGSGALLAALLATLLADCTTILPIQ